MRAASAAILETVLAVPAAARRSAARAARMPGFPSGWFAWGKPVAGRERGAVMGSLPLPSRGGFADLRAAAVEYLRSSAVVPDVATLSPPRGWAPISPGIAEARDELLQAVLRRMRDVGAEERCRGGRGV